MGRYLSEEQKKDLKLRLSVGVLLTTLAAGAYCMGPGLRHVLDHARAHKAEPWAAERFYQVGQIMEWTFREDQAQDVYEEFYLYYCGLESIDEDTSEYLFAEFQPNPEWWYYAPWVESRYDPDVLPRPRPVSAQRHPLLGRVLVSMGKHYEDRRLYTESNHIYSCLRENWEPGTFEHCEGTAAGRRDTIRTF